MRILARHNLLLAVGWLLVISTPTQADPISGTIIIGALISASISVGLSYLSALLAPKPKPIEVNKSDSRLQTSEYGQMIPRIRGTVGGVAGQVIHAFPFPFKDTVTTIPGQGGKRKTPDQITHSYSVTLAILLTDNAIQGVTKIIMDTEVFYVGAATGSEIETTPAGCSGMHIYLGTEDQLPDSSLESEYGVGEVSAYRGNAYIVIRDLVLDKFYNRIPNITCEIVADDGDAAEIVAAEMQLSGLTEDDYDLTELEGQTIGGLYIGQRASIRQTVLEPISQALFVSFIEIDGKITAISRNRASEVTVPFSDLGAYDVDQEGGANQNKPTHTETTRRQDQDIPRSVEVVYLDNGRDYEKGSQSFGREIYASFEREILTNTGQVAMTANAANKIAKIQAVTNWTEREPFSFTLPPKYVKYTPGTVMTVTTQAGREVDVLIEKMDIGVPKGLVKCSGRSYLQEAYTQTGEGDVGQGGSGTGDGGYTAGSGSADFVAVPIDTLLKFSPIDGLNPAYAGQSGFYLFVTTDPADTDPEHLWRGVTIYQDVAGSGTLRAIAGQGTPSTMGTATGTLADGSGVDTVNTVTVDLDYGTLASIETEDFDAARPLNLFIVGGEVIQARDITMPDPSGHPNRYTLAHLRRGMFGTTSAQATHGASEDVILLNGAASFVAIAPDETGDELGYYAAGPGQDPLATTRWDYTYGPGFASQWETYFGDGSTTTFTFTHNLNTTAPIVSFLEVATGMYNTTFVWMVVDANEIEVECTVPPTTDEFRIIIRR